KHAVSQPVNLRFFPTAGQGRDPSRPRRTDRLPGPCAPGPPPQTPGMLGPGRSPPSLQHPRPEGQSHASSRCPPRHPRLPCPTPNRSKPLPTDRSMTDEAFRFATLAIHAGQEPEPTTGAIMQPVFQTATYVQEGLGKPRKGHEYARVTNPTRSALEANVAALEGGKHGIAFSSGLAATEAIVKRLSAGDHVVTEENTYGGTTRLFTQVLSRFGIEFTFVDARDPDDVRRAIRPNTRLIHLETPTNPMMRLTDIRAIAEFARESGIHVSVDNTFASPYNQRPLDLGATIVVHSSTKYLNGHSDVIGGIVVTNDDQVAEDLRFQQKAVGAVPGPWDCWLVLRGTKTLHVRMERHNQNGQR